MRRLAVAVAAATALLSPAGFPPGTAAAASTAATVAATNGTVGWDSYTELDQLPYLTDGVSTREYSSFDRQQDNEDSGHNLGPAPGGGVLLAAHQGPGEIDSIWMTGSVPAAGSLRIVLDGKTVVDASAASIFSGSLGAPFVYPLVANNSQSSGGFYIDVPMPFTSSMQVSTDADPGYYHVDYRTFPDATGVSTFNPADSASNVLGLLDESGYSDPKGAISGQTTSNGTFQLMPGQSATVASGTGSGQITALSLDIPHLSHPAATPITDDGRAFGSGGSSRFTVSLNPANTGIRVTRHYDPSVGNQKANMTVNSAAAGQWNSGAATAAPGQWADQTLAAPASATAGKSSATIVNSFVSSDKDFNEFVYWVYQDVGGVWQLADTVDLGPEHQATEAAHAYSITGQTWAGTQMYSYPLPGAVTDNGYAFGSGGSSTFTVAIDPANTGVRLTRRLDPSVANQVAAVSVDGTAVGDWTANPAEPDGTWLDESLEIPASVTAGKSSITVHTTFVSSQIDFDEFSYWVDSHVTDGLERTDEFSVGNSASASAHDYSVTGQTFSGSRTYSYPTEDEALSSARIEISFDGVQTVNAPLGEFFGSATDTETRSLMSSIDARAGGQLTSWWPMPYGSNYSITIDNTSSQPLTAGQVSVTTAADPKWATDLASGAAGYFHATANSGPTTQGQDWTFLKASGHGKVVGVVAGLDGPLVPYPTSLEPSFMEGNERGFVDGSDSPQINGTGTEDYFEGGFYFQNGPFTDPLNGDTGQERNGAGDCAGSNTACYDAYRLMIGDAVGFDSQIDYGIEHGPHDNVQANYSTTTLWYGDSTPVESETDSIALGNNASEQAHDYTAGSQASADSLTSDYEGDDGTPADITQCVDDSSAAETFTLQVNPSNQGVVLQRTSDQDAGGQSADVTVDGTNLGTWLEPLANPYHRWLDDGFDVPASVSAGQSSITVTVTPTAGSPWSAAGYQAMSVLPDGAGAGSGSAETGSGAARPPTTTGGSQQTATVPAIQTSSVTAEPAATPAGSTAAIATAAATSSTQQTAVFPDGNGALDVGHHADGRLEVFAVSSANGVNSQVETAPESAWSGWCAYSPPGRVGQIVSAVHADGRLEEFAVTSNGGIENNFEVAPNSRWSGWAGFGPPSGTVASIQVARHADGRLEVFAVMSDGSVQNKYETAPDSTWSGWNDFAPTGTAASLAIGMHSDGRLEVFAVSSGGGVQNKFETVADGAWSNWADFGPSGAVTSLATADHADGRLEVFAVMSDGSVQNKYETAPDSTWSGWNDFAPAGTATDGLSVATHADGRLEAFAVSGSGGISNKYETAPDAAWAGWYGFGPSGTATTLTATTHADGRVEVFAVMSDGSVENKYETVADGAWSGWNDFASAGTA
ncbi:MAG TPA: DUF2961 domain-containing protein [Actinocrinis sp.]